jgi:hypothetical protein
MRQITFEDKKKQAEDGLLFDTQ